MAQIRARWPEVRIILRADSGFAREALMAWCEANGIHFIFGLARNRRLARAIGAELFAARDREPSNRTAGAPLQGTYLVDPQELEPQAACHRQGRVDARRSQPALHRHLADGGDGDGRSLYEEVYCARGEMENRIKECQMDLFADRTSTATLKANQLRLWFASMAYVLVNSLRRLALQATDLANASCGTLRRKLFKIGALVTISVRRIKFAMASGCPYKAVFATAHRALCAAAETS